MKWRSLAAFLAAIGVAISLPAFAFGGVQRQTIVFIRHGEKPAAGLGQLDCRGLNRALALPAVLTRKYGAPDYIFAPDPKHRVRDDGRDYNYVRPLATIEPTAIRLGMPVNTDFGYKDVEGLRRELLKPGYRNALVFVAWEHKKLVKAVKRLLGRKGYLAPDWSHDDYDSIYVLRLERRDGKLWVAFAHEREGLDGQRAECPG